MLYKKLNNNTHLTQFQNGTTMDTSRHTLYLSIFYRAYPNGTSQFNDRKTTVYTKPNLFDLSIDFKS